MTLPKKFNSDFKVEDIYRSTWNFGKQIGRGGFGLVYLGD